MDINERRKAHQGTNSSHISTQKHSLVFLLISSLPHFPLHFVAKHAQGWKNIKKKVGQRARAARLTGDLSGSGSARHCLLSCQHSGAPRTFRIRWLPPGAWLSPQQVVSRSTQPLPRWNLSLHGLSCYLPLVLIANTAPTVALCH